jgi:nucleoside-diphosphate-sugar epimerase
MKKALISGYNGFIGKHLRNVLIERNIEPIALSQFDLYLDPPQLTELIFHHRPSYIFLLHAYGNHRNQIPDETKSVMANYFATWNILKATEFLDYDALINFGTSSLYGIKDHPMSENDSFMPDTFYAATKAGAVYLARAFAKQYDRPICSVMPFSVFGEGEASHRFIPAVCEHLMTSQPLSVTLTPMHDWIYVKDFVNGVLHAVNNINELKGETLNIGTGKSTSNQKIIQMLEKISGKKLERGNDVTFHQYDSPIWQADIHKLSSLGWKQTISLQQGLERCFEYYSKILRDNKNDK